MPKSLKDIAAFLNDEWIACIATVDAQNRPHVVPIWFTYDDGKTHIQTDRKSVKARNLLKNPQVAVAVYNNRDEAVVIRGKDHIVENEGAFQKLTQLHLDKYNRLFNKVRGTADIEYIKLDEKGRDSMGIPLFDFKTRCVIEVTPETIKF